MSNTTSDRDRLRTEDMLPVMTRVSWGAILGGAFVALAVYALLAAVGVAFGLSVAPGTRGENIALGAGIWAIVSLLLSLFAGGCVTTRCTAGESRMEAVIYGVILWGVMLFMTLWVSGSVLRAGSWMMLGTANVAASSVDQRLNWEKLASEANLTEAQMAQIRKSLPSAGQVREVSAEAAWWSVGGIVASMLAAIVGALMGAGPTLSLRGISLSRTSFSRSQVPSPQG